MCVYVCIDLRYNDFTHDPLSRYNSTPSYTAFFAIAARGDLNDPNGSYPLPFLGYRLHGSTDVKLVNLAMVRSVSQFVRLLLSAQFVSQLKRPFLTIFNIGKWFTKLYWQIIKMVKIH